MRQLPADGRLQRFLIPSQEGKGFLFSQESVLQMRIQGNQPEMRLSRLHYILRRWMRAEDGDNHEGNQLKTREAMVEDA